MTCLLWGEIVQDLILPDFGEAFRAHMLAKKHPCVFASSLSTWRLLALALKENGYDVLPEAAFSDTGKPYFADGILHFSLSHSGRLAAVVVSDTPCGVDIEMIRPDIEEKLSRRCLSEDERCAGCDFFDVWTKKECIAKLDGRGVPSHPCRINTLDAQYENRFFTRRIFDSAGNEYALAALGEGFDRIEKRTII